MTDPKQIRAILNEIWPSHYEFVGEQNAMNVVHEVCAGTPLDQMFTSSDQGAAIDLSQAMEFLVEGTTLVKACLEIWQLLRDELKRSPSADEVENRLKTEGLPRDVSDTVKTKTSQITKVISRISQDQ